MFLGIDCGTQGTKALLIDETGTRLGRGYARHRPPGADGLTFTPFLNGERTPDLSAARGTITGISAANFTSAHLIRAVVEGVSFGILNGLDLIQHGNLIERMFVIGGGSRSPGWRQLLADASGTAVQAPVEEEAASLGAAMQAIHAHTHAQGKPESFESIANRCVKIDPTRSMTPAPDTLQEYAAARQAYGRALETLYGAPA